MVDLPKDIVTDTPFTVTCYGEQCPVVYVSEIITPQNGPAYREISIFY